MVPSARVSAIRAPLRHYLDELQALVPNRLVFDPHTRPRTFRIRGTEFRVLMCWHHPQQHRDPGSQWLRDNLSAALAAGEMVGEPARPVPVP